jgi:hypothetical protein
MKNLTYSTEVHSIDYGYLTVEFDYFEADDSVGLSEVYDWFAYTTEDFEDEPAGTEVTYELTAADQALIYSQIKKHHIAMLEDFHA